MKKIIIAIIILGCLAGIVLGGNALLENAYWASSAGTGVPDISRYQEDILLSKDYNAELHQYSRKTITCICVSPQMRSWRSFRPTRTM